ncbi:hypothetical protein [Kribbella deserti]|uniref:EVE domain-containing protein n=1 Tax=Kribbella deserti TaxID=1926257 RepID=A0ABV6QPC7_9ACTN
MAKVSIDELGAWVLKCNPKVTNVPSLLADRGRSIETWCVADNYRSALFEAGQPVLFWVSGPARGKPEPGIWGRGLVTGPARQVHGKYVVPVELELFDQPVSRTLIAGHGPLRGIEPIRQPVMSNPSYVTKAELAALEELAFLPETPAGIRR